MYPRWPYFNHSTFPRSVSVRADRVQLLVLDHGADWRQDRVSAVFLYCRVLVGWEKAQKTEMGQSWNRALNCSKSIALTAWAEYWRGRILT